MNAITKTNGNGKHVPAIIEARLPCDAEAAKQYGVEPGQWRVLVESVWPSARSAAAVFLALDYCRSRKLDPFKRPCHIVPMWNSTLRKEVETVWPGISDIRITAARTTEYAGADETIFGQEATETFDGKAGSERLTATVTFPTWARVTVYRIIKGIRVPFPGPRVIWKETYAQAKGTPVPNARWQRAPYQMLEKCAEAAALRKAFPEELGSLYAAEEMEGRPVTEDTVSYTDVREEAQFIVSELKSCGDRDQLDGYWNSAPVKEFLARADTASAGRSGINQADVVTQYYHQYREKLPEIIVHNPMKEQSALSERRPHEESAQEPPARVGRPTPPAAPISQDAGESIPDVAPEASRVLQPPASPQETYEGETTADKMEMDFLASIDSCDSIPELQRVRAEIENCKDDIGDKMEGLKRACVARKKEIEIGATLDA